ncbi:hypothetical protein N4R57_16320 [Rhodobacteraceae bacterium D3-12]|nr:hypothetical protein N4R57_16320 [Rhodobacteraceae bacterium D3-12]
MRTPAHGSTSLYANAAWIIGAINLFWSLLLIYTSFGMHVVLVLAVAFNFAITRLARHQAASRFHATDDLNLTLHKENKRLN